MQLITALDAFPEGLRSVVTIGKFDGVHQGHRAVIATLRERARAEGVPAAVLTFDRNPLELLRPEQCPPALVSVGQKSELLEASGIDVLAVLPFTADFAALEPEEFVQRILVDGFGATTVLVGADFRFGHRGRGDVELLLRLSDELGFAVQVVPQTTVGGTKVSSTRIRRLLDEGDVVEAARLLGRAPALRGEVVHGAKRGRELGFPTANLSPDSEGMIPADGVYAGELIDGGRRYAAAISVGSNPTFDGVPAQQVEAHLPGQELDLYGHRVEVVFRHRIRGMVAFTTIEALVEQMHDDVAQALRLQDGAS